MQWVWRGGDDPSGYKRTVVDELRQMRLQADVTLRQMAELLSRELGRNINAQNVWQWECGVHIPGADVYRAYINISGAARPLDVHSDPRQDQAQRVAFLEDRIRKLERETAAAEGPEPDDLLPAAMVARSLRVSKQTIHNYIDSGSVRFRRRGHQMFVSASDAEAERDRRAAYLQTRRRSDS